MIENGNEIKPKEVNPKPARKDRGEKLAPPMVSASEMIFNVLSYHDHQIENPHQPLDVELEKAMAMRKGINTMNKNEGSNLFQLFPQSLFGLQDELSELFTNPENIPNCLKIPETTASSVTQSAADYKMLAEMVIKNKQYWPIKPNSKDQQEQEEKEALLLESMALQNGLSGPGGSARDDVKFGYNDKIFSVQFDDSRKVNKMADNPFQMYSSRDVDPLIITSEEEDQMTGISPTVAPGKIDALEEEPIIGEDDNDDLVAHEHQIPAEDRLIGQSEGDEDMPEAVLIEEDDKEEAIVVEDALDEVLAEQIEEADDYAEVGDEKPIEEVHVRGSGLQQDEAG